MFSSRLHSESCPMNQHGKSDDVLNIKLHPSSNSSTTTTLNNSTCQNNYGSNNNNTSPSSKTTRRSSTDYSLSPSMVLLTNTPKNLDTKTQRRQSSSAASLLSTSSTHSDSIISLFKNMGKGLSSSNTSIKNKEDHNTVAQSNDSPNSVKNQLSPPSSSTRPFFSSQTNIINSPSRKNYFNFDETKYENSCKKAIEAGEPILKITLKDAKDKKLATGQLYYYVEIEILQSSKRECLKSCVKQGEETVTWNEEFYVSISPSIEETFSISLWSSIDATTTENAQRIGQSQFDTKTLVKGEEKLIAITLSNNSTILEISLTPFNFGVVAPHEPHSPHDDIPIAAKPVDGVYNSRYKVCGRIGKGNFGTVVKVKDLQDGKEKAMKIVPCSNLSESSQAYREATTTKQIKHENLVEYLDIFISRSEVPGTNITQFDICLVMPIYVKGDLYAMVDARSSTTGKRYITPNMLVEKIYEFAKGLECLHLHNIVHRDMKLKNTFFDETYRVKIGDFGFSRFVHDGEKAHTICGSPNYTAPEIENSAGYGKEVDIWSLGVMIYEMATLNIKRSHLSARTDFESYISTLCSEVMQAYKDKSIHEPLIELLKGTIALNPQDRWSASQCVLFLKKLREQINVTK
ncbi:hypothetical protein C9374_013430 [Naegleria lovaniensis]|uniref:Protein kinase domain-containing protein n=1 Tax=Naegleria lovaniensis TaxID=51637 RepID=A0AA88KVH5_NAELO|nr:uncharacterized protein C9374_013430 [Naegleria lovaniensis]KAG2391945.1 hypothetical protein C9374_013430 [Naegleria lovaniensis]